MTNNDERCWAILDYIYHWRCSRRAVSKRGLCAQHDRLGATVPEWWDHIPHYRQKVACNPHPPFHKINPSVDESGGLNDQNQA